MNQKLPKNIRLCDDSLIESLFKKGEKIQHGAINLRYLPSETFRVGFGAPKRKFHKAVERNRIKRLLREAFRLHYEDVLKKDYKGLGYFIFNGNACVSFDEIENSMIEIMKAWKVI